MISPSLTGVTYTTMPRGRVQLRLLELCLGILQLQFRQLNVEAGQLLSKRSRLSARAARR